MEKYLFITLAILVSGCREDKFFTVGETYTLKTEGRDFKDQSAYTSSQTAETYLYFLKKNSIVKEGIFSGVLEAIPFRDSSFNVYDKIFVKSPEEIYLFERRTGCVAMANSSGDALHIRGGLRFADSTKFQLSITPNNRPFLIDSTLFVSILPWTKLEYFYQYPFESTWTEQMDSVHFFLTFPKQYSAISWWHVAGNEVSRAPNNNKEIVYSFPMNDTLFVYSHDGILKRKVSAPSGYLGDFPPPPIDERTENNSEMLTNYVMQLKRYGAILYDPYRDRCYRIAIHWQPLKNNEGIKNVNSDAPWSIIVLNADLQILGEQKIEPHTYTYDGIIVTPRGLLVRNNYFHSKENRNKISYTLFEPIQ
jgi:hypothetical protein